MSAHMQTYDRCRQQKRVRFVYVLRDSDFIELVGDVLRHIQVPFAPSIALAHSESETIYI